MSCLIGIVGRGAASDAGACAKVTDDNAIATATVAVASAILHTISTAPRLRPAWQVLTAIMNALPVCAGSRQYSALACRATVRGNRNARARREPRAERCASGQVFDPQPGRSERADACQSTWHAGSVPSSRGLDPTEADGHRTKQPREAFWRGQTDGPARAARERFDVDEDPGTARVTTLHRRHESEA